MARFRNFFRVIISCLLILCCFIISPTKNYADSKVTLNNHKQEIIRSLESLKDLDYQTWQIIVYPSSKVSNKLNLRIVGYPGSLRMNHPTDLVVKAGRKEWDLEDITKKSKEKFETLNDSVAEFDLTPLITELDKNRPLRMRLPGLINDLPIPPYLVSEWRTLVEKND